MDFTPVLLMTLVIAWAAAGLYWLRTRAVVPSLHLPHVGRRRLPMTLLSAAPELPRARVVPLHGSRDEPSGAGTPTTRPATSLLQSEATPAPIIHQRSPVTSEQARLRRRNVLLALAGAAALTLLLAFVVGGAMILVNLFFDALLLGYVLLLVQYQREIELERTQRLPVLGPPSGRYAAGSNRRIV